MTDKQRKFCDEYLIDLNATRAYKLAYPNVKSESAATSGASRLLRNVKVKTYIDEQLKKSVLKRLLLLKKLCSI